VSAFVVGIPVRRAVRNGVHMIATHTYGETPHEAISGQVRNLDGGKFSMELPPQDLVTIVEALLVCSEAGENDPTPIQDNAGQLRTDILSVLGLEEI
jgi:hypothetical protein